MTHPADKSAVVLNSSSNLYHWSMFRLIVVASCRDQTWSIQCQYLIQVNYRAQLKIAGYNLNCSTFPLLEGFYGPHFIAMVCQTHNIMSCSCALEFICRFSYRWRSGKKSRHNPNNQTERKGCSIAELNSWYVCSLFCEKFWGGANVHDMMYH